VALSDIKKNRLASPVYQAQQTVKGTVEPGEQAVFMYGSAATDLHIIQQTTKQAITTETKDQLQTTIDFISLSNQLSTASFTATESDRGGYAVNRFFVKDNRVYTINWMVNVPWTNKELKISFETFRIKLLPGQEEKWKVKVSGYRGDAIAAEMLAGMYDASLDQFRPHSWSDLNNLWECKLLQ
jgi:hypothetical protein